jgi:hypothetical protein
MRSSYRKIGGAPRIDQIGKAVLDAAGIRLLSFWRNIGRDV